MLLQRNAQQYLIVDNQQPTAGATTSYRVPIKWSGLILGWRAELTKDATTSNWTTCDATFQWYADAAATVAHTPVDNAGQFPLDAAIAVPTPGNTNGKLLYVISGDANAMVLPPGEIEVSITLDGTLNNTADNLVLWMLTQN